MLKKIIARAGLLALLFSTAACADEASVKKTLSERFPDLPPPTVSKSPMPGWYEVFAGSQMFYVDEKVEYVFLGNLIEAKTKRNLTEARIRDLLRVKFDALPFEDAIKIVKGNGSRKIAVFEDPDCPFCKQLEAELAKLDNYTMYVFLLPLDSLHPDAARKSRQVWCAKDRSKAWLELMSNNKLVQNKGDCANPVERNLKLASELRISGTPAVVFEDGRMVPGAIPRDRIEKFWEEIAARKAAPAPKPAEAPAPAPAAK